MQKFMKKLGVWLCAALLVISLGGCAASEDASGYTDYNGVQIPNEDIENMRNMLSFIDGANMPSDDDILRTLAWQQVQYDEAERLGLMPSRAEAEKDYMANYIEPVMHWLAIDDPSAHESSLFFLMLLQEQGKALGLSHDEFCDYLISQWQNMLGTDALYQHFLNENGLTPVDMWATNLYNEYVENLLAQAADSKEA